MKYAAGSREQDSLDTIYPNQFPFDVGRSGQGHEVPSRNGWLTLKLEQRAFDCCKETELCFRRTRHRWNCLCYKVILLMNSETKVAATGFEPMTKGYILHLIIDYLSGF